MTTESFPDNVLIPNKYAAQQNKKFIEALWKNGWEEKG